MSATSIPVARILQLGVPIAWQEAVELTLAADKAAIASGAGILLEECTVTPDGTVQLASVPGRREGTPLTTLQFLGLLLEGQSAPPELRALVKAGGDALFDFPAEHADESAPTHGLSWFASPNPAAEIARLAGRAIEVSAVASANTAVAQLGSEVTVEPKGLPPAPKTSAPQWSPAFIRWSPAFVRPLALAAAVVLFVAVVFSARAMLTRTTAEAVVGAPETRSETPPLETPPPETPPPVTAASGTAPAEGTAGTSQPAPRRAPSAAANPPAATTAKATTGKATTATATTARAARPSGSAALSPRTAAIVSPGRPAPALAPAASIISSSPVPVAVPPPAPEPRPGPAAGASSPAIVEVPRPFRPAPASVTATAGVRLYSLHDEDVEPPVFLRPQLPSEAKPDSDQSESYIEVTVDERGQVAQVRLRSSDASLNDRMIVAAAKAWQFRPAVKDGRPVSYVLTVPVTR